EGVDDASGASDVVRDPDDAALVQHLSDAWLGKLVVGRADDGRASQARHNVTGKDAAEGRGDQDVGFGRGALVGVCPGRSEFRRQVLLCCVDVADHKARPSGGELAGEMPAHAAKTADREEVSAEIAGPYVLEQAARSAATTPVAVCGDESPLPPSSGGLQNTWPVRSPMMAMSAGAVPTSGPVA